MRTQLNPSQRNPAMLIAVSGFLVTLSSPVYAYIDPVTGSFLIQGLVAGVMAIVAGVRSVRQRIFGLFVRKNRMPENGAEANQ